ncbi:MAG: NUDIX domain-containing protein [bacterium]|nr:NUDIX domain-containing protein [bacterium]
MAERIANFCPICGESTIQAERFGRLRPVCPACGHVVFFDPKVAVVAFVLREGCVLLIQRSSDVSGAGKWALPGGYVEADEDPREAIQREMLEETGLHVEIGPVLDVFYGSTEGGTITIAYTAHVRDGVLTPGDDAAAVGWFAPDALPELVFLSTETLVARWITGNPLYE